MSLSSLEQILDKMKMGGMIILTDDEDRENEGDLVISAQYADAAAINFMARFGRGLVCLALEEERVATLGLPLMSAMNRSRHGTAFTVSIEAKDGITTGISAADRARTIAVAIDELQSKEALVSPGHVFPLVAARGGVLVRAGHTEAAVDLARLAGLHPSGVICEIMNDDGTMARQKDLLPFAQKHQLPMARISDLIAWRLAKEQHIDAMGTELFTTRDAGTFTLKKFKDDIGGGVHVALVKGDLRQQEELYVRVHAFGGMMDMVEFLRDGEQDKNYGIHLLRHACAMIEERGAGVVLLIDSKTAARQNPQRNDGLRHYGIGAQILRSLGVRDMVLLTNSQTHIHALDGFGLRIVKRMALGKSLEKS